MFSFEELFDRVIAPWALLAGVAVGLIGFALGGRVVARHNMFHDFQRFTPETDYQTNYRIGANQLQTLLRESALPDQIVVVVGGNSVLYGFFQGRDGLWTRQLQAELGDRYKVVNLAQPGAGPAEFGALAAEMLHREGSRRVIVISGNWLTPCSPIGEPDGRPIVQWLFWDAHNRELLSDDPEREAALARPLTERVDAALPGGTDQTRRNELQRQEALDHWLNYRDLWNAFEYKYATTVWCKPLAKSWYRARECYPDSDPTQPPASQALLDALQPQWMEMIRSNVAWHRAFVRRPSGELIAQAELGGPFPSETSLRAAFPAPMRERLIVIAHRHNPYFVNMLTPDERTTYDALGPAMTTVYARVGVRALEVGRGYSPEDYADHGHLTVAGGRRMAADVAPAVRQLAAKLGYLEEAKP